MSVCPWFKPRDSQISPQHDHATNCEAQPTGNSHFHTHKVMKALTSMKLSLMYHILLVAAAMTFQCRNLLMTLFISK
jgi:hypothetical protein